jgi:hypothetical protein
MLCSDQRSPMSRAKHALQEQKTTSRECGITGLFF